MSSTRLIIKDRQIITAGTMTGTAVITSNEVDVSGADIAAIDFTWTGTAVGTFTVEVAVHLDPATGAGVNWAVLTTSPATLSAAGTAGTIIVNLPNLGCSRLRAKYTNTSSTGVLNAWITAKGF
jgi:hypothetical protein